MLYRRPRIERDAGGYYHFLVTVDGEPTIIDAEQKLRRFGLIFLGAEFEEVVKPQMVPADPDDSRPDPMEVFGFTADEEMVALYDAYQAIAESDEGLREGPIPIE